MSWSGHYCLFLDEMGRPCNRRTMHLGMCERHRDAAPRQQRDSAAQRAHQARHRAKRRRERELAGVSDAMEGA